MDPKGSGSCAKRDDDQLKKGSPVDPITPDSTVTDSTKDDDQVSDTGDLFVDAEAAETLMDRRHDPESALHWYRWYIHSNFRGNHVWDPKDPLLFCVLLHILSTSSVYHGLIIKLLGSYVSLCPGITLYNNLLRVQSCSCCKRMLDKRFRFRPWVYTPLLTAYARAGRFQDAIHCFKDMLTKHILPESVAVNALLRLLINKGMPKEAKQIFADIVSNKVVYDCETIRIMMNLSLQQKEDGESPARYLLDAITHPPVEYAVSHNYRTAIDSACNKLNSKGACLLLCQMITLGINPPEETFTNVICTFVKTGDLFLALKVNGTMRDRGLSLKTSVLTSLVKEFILQGDLGKALELFGKIRKFRLRPDQDAYAAIIEGCCNHGKLDMAVELNNRMKNAGIQSSGEILHSLIKGFFKAGMHDEGLKLLNEAMKDGVAITFTYDDVVGWFHHEGLIDEPHTKHENSADKGVEEMLGHGEEGSTVSGLSQGEKTCRSSCTEQDSISLIPRE